MAAVRPRQNKRAPVARATGRATEGASDRRSRPDSQQVAGRRQPTHAELRVRRFDADRQDREISLEQALKSSPTSRQLIWVDATGDVDPEVLDALGRRFKFGPETRRSLERPTEQPGLAVHGSYFHLSVAAEPGGTEHGPPTWLHIAAARNVVITRQSRPLTLLNEIDDRIKSDATLGSAEGAEFVALLLDGVVTSYFAAVDEIEEAIDDLDRRALRDSGRSPVLDDLVELRHRISGLRRLVSRHRSLFAAVSGPELRQLVEGPEAVADLQAVSGRFEAAVAGVESSRDALLGSFDVYMTRTAQRTNEVMKILTIATVLLLPGTVIAGLMGMNVVVPLNKDDPLSFWLVIGGVLALAVSVLVAARVRRWI